MTTSPRRSLDGRAISASSVENGDALLNETAQYAIAQLCEYLENLPPYRVRSGSVICPMRKLQLRREMKKIPWPVPVAEATEALSELAYMEDSIAGLLGWKKDMKLAWVGATLKTNILIGSDTRAEAAWFENLIQEHNNKMAEAGLELRGWQTSSGYVTGFEPSCFFVFHSNIFSKQVGCTRKL